MNVKKIRYFFRDIRFFFKFFLIKINFFKGYVPNISKTKINIGGGEWNNTDWENLDIIYNYKLENELLKKFPNNKIDLIYTSHCIEHLSFQTTAKLLKDAYRVLKSGATIRIVVPDTDKLLKIYKDNINNLNFKFYNEGERSIYSLKESILELFGFNLQTNEFLKNSMHLSFYSISSIKLLLISAGFNKFRIYSFGNSEITEFTRTLKDYKDGFDNPSTKDISLYIEATK